MTNNRRRLTKKSEDKRDPVIGIRIPQVLHKRAIAMAMQPPINKNSRELYMEAVQDWIDKYSGVRDNPYRAAFGAVSTDERDFLTDALTLYRHAESSPELTVAMQAIRLMIADRSAALKKLRSGK